MNKIYKVIWSKVKHQYVVVSELAHSNGKQSRTSRNSIRSRIAALVVCGAITAFGVYGALPNSAFAEVAGGEATQSQYIAIAIEGNPGEGNNDATWHKGSWPFQEGYWELNDEKRYGDYTYIRQTVTVGDSQKQYWVRKGYDITAIQGERHESINNNTDYIIDAKKNAQYDASSDQGLLQAYQTTTSKGKITTLTGVNIEDLDTGVYGGASNTSGVTTPSTFGYHIKVGGVGAASDGYIRVTNDPKSSNANFSTYFSHDINLENNGSYSYINSNGEKVIVPSNKVYSIDGKLGVFTDAKGNLYTGDVYGDNNEILLSGSDGNKIYSYWGTKINDLSQTIGNMTVQDYNSDRKKLQDQAAAYHGDDITNIAVGGANNNGTISLNRVGQYNDQTGEYETTDPVPGTITVTSTGGNGGSGAEHDVKIKFSNTENPDGFSVDAGSKVEAVPGENDKISAIKINGEKYNLGTGGTITGSFNLSTGEISVEQDGKSVLAGKIHDYALDNQEKTASDGSVTLTGRDRYGTDTFDVKIDGLVTEDNLGEQIKTKNNLKVEAGDKGRWTITDTSKEEGSQVFTNTTLADKVETSGTKDSGYTYTVKDTAGNTAQLTDIASATKLSEVNKQVNTNTENIASLDGRVTVNEGNITDLGDRVTVNEGDITDLGNRVTVNEGDITDLGNRVTVNEGDITTIKGNMITGGQGNDDGTITLTGAEGKNIATVTGLHDYAIDKQDVTVKDGSVSLKVTDRYDKNNTYDVTIDGIVTDDTVATKNNLKVEAGEKGRWTITDTSKEEGSQVFTNTTLADKVEKTGDKDSGYTYTVKDTAGNTAVIKDVASAEKLSSVDSKVGDTNYSSTNYIHNEDNLTEAASTLDSAIKATADKVDAGWALYSDGNKIKDVKPGDNWISVDAGENVSISKNENGNGLTISADLKDLDVEDTNAVLYDDDDKTTVTLAGTNGTRITNVAKGDISEKSTEAVNGSQLYATNQKVDAGWTATDGKTGITVSPTNNTLKFAGDNNITVTADAENNAINVELNPDVNLKGEGKNSDNRVWLSGSNGTITATTENNLPEKTTVINGGNVYVGSSISVGDKVEITDKDITGLSNTSWNGTTDDESRAATEGQLKDVSDTVNAGWTATDSNGASIVVNPENGSTLNFAGDRNIEVKANEKDGSIDVSLKDDIVLGGKEDTSRVEIGGTNGTIMATKDPNSMAATTTIDGGNVYVGSSISVGDKVEITDKDITGLSNTEWNGTTTTPDRAATEGQLQQVSNDVNAGWIATDNNGSQVNITPDNNKLNFAGDENITVTAANNEIKVALNDDIVLGDYLNGGDGVLIGGSSGTISATNSITVGEDQGLIIDGQKKEIQGLSNTTWNEDVANAVERDSVAASTAATQGQLQEVSKVANAGWNASDGTNSISVKPNETLNFVGDENLTVSADGTDKKLKVSLNDNITLGEGPNQIQLNGAPGANDPALSVGTDKFVVDQDGSLSVSDKFNVDAETGNIYAANNSGSAIMMNDDSVALNAGGNGIAISDEGILLNTNGINEDIKLVTKGTSVSVDSNGTTFTNTNTGETTNINGGTITTNTVKGLDNTTWSEDLAEEVANNEELQGTAATQGQLQQAVSEVAEVANAGWNAKAGGNTINVKPNETLNFEGDGNITVSATSGTSSELKFGLNHNITLDNVENEKTMMVFNTDGREGYIPDNYKEDNGQINDFIEEHGGFAIYYANPSLTTGDMTGTFGVTTDGVVHAKDVISYYSASSGSQSDVIRYSLNDVGDIVTQISHAVFDEGVGSTGMEYTLISDFEDEADKDSPFDAKEGKTRTIGLAVRQDGAVIVGAVVNDEGISSDRGIRINAETKTTYDKNGNEVTNNIATITGLENTEWKPPTPVATFAANDGSATVTSRAATESQLNDLYSAVAAYDVNVDGTIDYSHIALAGTPYGASRSGNGTHTGGTSITNVAYASGKDGSEAVNVDYLNDAISDAAENGSISTSDQHLVANTETGSNGVYKPNDDGNVNLIVSDEKGNSSTITIGDVASKEDLDNLKDDVGDLDYSKVEGDTIIDGDSVTDAIGKLDNKIDNITGTATDADNNTVTGGKINSDGTISLTQKDKDSIKLEGQLTDSGVVQEGTSFDKETGTITITSQDKYSGETSSVKVEGIASTEVVGATNKEDLATAYKDADKDGNATTEYITDSESMVEADVALDHAIQDVAGTSYANDMVLSNRIDSVEKRLGNVEERIDKVGAMAAAIANLRTMGFDPEAPTEIAIGVGQYKSETGIAIGVFHYPNQDFMLSASLSSSGDELMGGIGATWKLGRKSAAERAKDEEARHLEQAEEMKKLAQQEKVKAQAQRHAKLLAERQQASQKNA